MIEPVRINNRLVGPGHRPYIIAEACINHEGDIAIAEQMVHVAHAMGVDCIKFQIHVLEDEMLREAPQSHNFADPLWDTLERTNLSVDEHRRLKTLCESLGIDYLCSTFSRIGTDILDEEVGVSCYKMGSGELTNLPLVEHVARKGKPLILSSGMSEYHEVKESVDLVKSIGTPLILTHCVSAYPCPYERTNLRMIERYAADFQIPVGMSDHSRGIYTSLGAIAVGACLIEKHFTLDKMAPGPDHASSIEPYELGELAKGCAAVYQAMGDVREIFPEEREIVAWARESVVSVRPIAAGTTITADMVWVKRPSPGDGCIPAREMNDVIGQRATTDIPADVQIKREWLNGSK